MTATGVDRAASPGAAPRDAFPAAVSRPAASRLATALQERAQQLSSDKTSQLLMVRLHELIIESPPANRRRLSEAALYKLRRDSAGLPRCRQPGQRGSHLHEAGRAADIAAAVPLLQRLLKEPLLLWQERVVVKQFIERRRRPRRALRAAASDARRRREAGD